MTLNDKLYQAICKNVMDGRYVSCATDCEKVCDDFALQFAKWISSQIARPMNNYSPSEYPLERLTEAEILQKFKTEVYDPTRTNTGG